MFGFKKRRRQKARNQPFPPEWLTIIEQNVRLYRELPADDQAELRQHIQVFLAEKQFEGCGSLEVTEEMRVTIAAQACILLLHRDTDYYPGLHTILVYPRRYFATLPRRQPDGTIVEGPQARLGESWVRGSVVLSWDDVLHGGVSPHDCHNVVFHEFAHQLDGESDGICQGAPALPDPTMYAVWAQVLGEEYEQLVKDVHAHRPNLLNPYGATNPAEFFAVATECFLEKPRALRTQHPKLYEQLKLFYQQDPANR